MKTLDDLIISYGEHNKEFTDLRKVCDAEKLQIKNSMVADGIDAKVAGGWKVTCSITNRESVNEEQMLQILKKDWAKRHGSETCPYIKTREYVDTDALEKAIYAEELPQYVLIDLDTCRTTTEVATLRCTKAKKEDSYGE